MTKRVRMMFLLTAVLISSCTQSNPPVTTTNTTVNSPAVTAKSQVSILTPKDIAELEKEYSAFTTKSASQAYVRKKLDIFLDTASNGASIKGPQLLREVEFARIKGETEIPMKALFASVPLAELYNKVATASAISTSINSGNVPLEVFINFTVNPLPQVPGTLTSDTITSTGFTARWGTVTGATAYEIVVNNLAPVNVGLATSYNAAITGTGHTFKVRAIKNALPGAYTADFNVAAIPATPSVLSTTNLTTTGFTANWGTVAGATGYEIKIGSNAPVSTGTNNFYAGTGTPGTTYSFQVRAIKDSATGDYSNPTSVTLIPLPVSSGLILNLDAGNTASYPGSGTAWTDLSGSGNHGTLTAGTTFNSSNGGGITFTGGAYANLTNINLSTGTGDFTWSSWVKTPAIFPSGSYCLILGSSQYYAYLALYEAQFTFDTNSNGVFRFGPNLSPNTWYNVTVVKQANVDYAYINGTYISSETDSTSIIAPKMYVGNWAYSTENIYPYTGLISKVMIYNRALSLTEVQQNHNSVKSRFGL